MMESSRLSRSPLSIETSNRGKIFPQTQRSKTPTYERKYMHLYNSITFEKLQHTVFKTQCCPLFKSLRRRFKGHQDSGKEMK